eukprot:Plantae.Rhodophyta-Palmaria_palmata.ctg9112.p3 GENE.Plantae.Rhodophyta-Palmaria_palmata.ctg9112~~Plantae.Rhodophyta-Palmaria_palmata.ctg9112.p3  ORF type:complete len:135 (-),score=15.65 Plantae.Rhodophyta-Palmaria_palmata.ctg9112:169-573(-)
MCGYLSCYAAILQTTVVYSRAGGVSNMKNPFEPSEAFSWCERAIKRKQCAMTPDVVDSFLNIAGYELSRMHGQNFAIIMQAVQKFCVEGASKASRQGARTRLALYVQEYVAAGSRIHKVPDGKVLPRTDSKNAG